MTTVCQANAAILPRLKDNGSEVRFQASRQAVVSAGPNVPQAQAHIVDGKFGTPKVTLELTTPRGESAVMLYAAAHVQSSNPPDAESEVSDRSVDRWRQELAAGRQGLADRAPRRRAERFLVAEPLLGIARTQRQRLRRFAFASATTAARATRAARPISSIARRERMARKLAFRGRTMAAFGRRRTSSRGRTRRPGSGPCQRARTCKRAGWNWNLSGRGKRHIPQRSSPEFHETWTRATDYNAILLRVP